MNERFITSLKLISSHVVMLLLLLVASGTLSNYVLFLPVITQTVLLILYFSGYREFFGLRFRRIFCGGIDRISFYSGYTERPHLHMQPIRSDSPDYWTGTGICTRYNKENLYKNRLIIK
jgi:hypothetical protein